VLDPDMARHFFYEEWFPFANIFYEETDVEYNLLAPPEPPPRIFVEERVCTF
jgi:hypothetical protein